MPRPDGAPLPASAMSSVLKDFLSAKLLEQHIGVCVCAGVGTVMVAVVWCNVGGAGLTKQFRSCVKEIQIGVKKMPKRGDCASSLDIFESITVQLR